MTKRDIVLATGNAEKIAEISEMFERSGVPVNLIPIKQLVPDFNPEEPGRTYFENALIKARLAAQLTGLPALADDSGVEILELNLLPGVDTAYFGHEFSVDSLAEQFSISKELAANARPRLATHMTLADPNDRYAARMVATLVFMEKPLTAFPLVSFGELYGEVTAPLEQCLVEGFAFNPIFYPSCAHNEKNMEQLSTAVRNNISHRGRAAADMANKLTSWANGEWQNH